MLDKIKRTLAKKGQMGILPAIITVAAAIITLVMIAVIVAYFTGSIDTGNMTTVAKGNFDTVVNNGWTALKLTAILLFVVVMAVALSVLGGLVAFR